MESIPFKNIVCILMLCVSPFLIIGCTGEEDEEPTREGEYFLKFKANGIEKRYEALPNSNASFFYLPDYKIYGGAIMGVKNIQQATKDVVSIQLFNETTYETNKTYQLQDAVSVDLFRSEGEYFLKFKANGIEKRYEALPNSNASFFYLPDYKIYGGAIMGVKNIQQATKDVVSIQLFNETTYETNKTYQLQDAVSVDLF